GQDATDAVNAFHPWWVIDQKMPAFCIGDLTPESRTTSKISTEFRKLDAKLHSEGFYDTDYFFFAREAAKFLLMWAAMICLVVYPPIKGVEWLAYGVSALIGASLWHQAAFVAHDAGHSGITHDAKTDMIMGICLGNLLGGVSLGWWKHNHNVHHIVTNDPEHDPDIQHMPFLAVSTRFFKNLYSSYYKRIMPFDGPARVLVSIQHYIFYVVLCFGRFNLYVLSWSHVTRPGRVLHRKQEIVCLTLFWVWYTMLLARLPTWGWVAGYVMVSHMATMFLHLQITLSHFGMCTKDVPGEEFAAKALRTTMDIECPRWMDWFHGGLQYQVEHHLFPRLPRHNLRKIQPLVRQFAKDNSLPFHSYGFIRSNKVVLGVLRDVANQIGVVLAVDPSKVHLH
ncbi:fatty acid desaturase-domain-containing protein, partial [Blyttiomyces helicus]